MASDNNEPHDVPRCDTAGRDPARRDGRRALGGYGERLAEAHLVGDGMRILARNWRCRFGELDLIAREPAGALVFCEVKTRRSVRYGPPEAAVVPAKAARIRRLAAQWMSDTDTHHAEVRFDVVAVLLGDRARLEHLRGVL